jgi:hypothetical protein
VVNVAILNLSAILKFWKKLLLQYFILNNSFKFQNFNWFAIKLTKFLQIRVCRPSWISKPFYPPLTQNLFFFLIILYTTLKLIEHVTKIECVDEKEPQTQEQHSALRSGSKFVLHMILIYWLLVYHQLKRTYRT